MAAAAFSIADFSPPSFIRIHEKGISFERGGRRNESPPPGLTFNLPLEKIGGKHNGFEGKAIRPHPRAYPGAC
ncbi:unnamed protein product [Bursaphelenchus xylophilus]|uniref:(pine wood nematode) hypothetical protein n=1 Tax=Bursaphelenchus xylophilus TaxID=6326 RepID=A0A1I7SR85_BURXY|nr:unnamed protein product [Bursaphelenchus xylophilus]CAG9110976.1 unnamed protein product [Bursaphelenchus xylophilus]